MSQESSKPSPAPNRKMQGKKLLVATLGLATMVHQGCLCGNTMPVQNPDATAAPDAGPNP